MRTLEESGVEAECRNTGDIRAAYQAGVNSYIQKPASARIFERIIQSLEDYWFRVVTLPEVRN